MQLPALSVGGSHCKGLQLSPLVAPTSLSETGLKDWLLTNPAHCRDGLSLLRLGYRNVGFQLEHLSLGGKPAAPLWATLWKGPGAKN